MKLFLKWWIIFFVIGFFILSSLGYYFWPGKFVNDTITQINQSLGYEPLTDQHPILTFFLINIFVKISAILNNNFYYLGFQLLFISVFISFTITLIIHVFFHKLENINKLIFGSILSFIFSIAPPNGIFHVTLIKDNYSTWIFVSFVVLISSYLYTLFTIKSNLKIFFLISFVGGISLLFRKNSYTLVMPFVIFVPIVYYLFTNKNKKFVIKNIFIYFSIYISIFSLNFIINKINFEEKNSFWKNYNIKDWTIQNDFLMGLKLDLPILTADEKLELSKIINIEETKKRSSINNSFFQLEFINSEGKRTIYSEELINFGYKTLSSHPLQWLKIKVLYSRELISSNKSYKLPSPGFENFNIDKRYKINLTMNENLQDVREKFRYYSGLDNGLYIFRVGIWNYWPILIFQSIILFILILYFIVCFFNKRIYFFLKSNKIYLSILTIPIISSMLLSFPLLLISATNDYRYFWACNIFTVILIILILSYLLKLKYLINKVK